MDWVFRDYGISSKHEKEPLPPRDDVVEFDMNNDEHSLENNLKLQGCSSAFQYKVKEVVTDYWDLFC